MAFSQTRISAEEFDLFAVQPENAERLLELIAGEIVEVPSNPYCSKIAARIITYIGMYLLQHDIAHITGEAGGFMVSGERYAPDVAVILKSRQPELAHEVYNPLAPDLAVEVISPTDSQEKLHVTLLNYHAAGTIVWVVYPHERIIEVCVPMQPVKILDEDGTLDGGEILPDFALRVSDVFAG
jgi:Uma2 family endonuclease